MSILDIIIFVVGGIIIGIYAFLSIRQTVRFKKTYNNYLKTGLTPLQAKEQALKECYPKKYKKTHKNTHDEIFED